MGIAPLTGDEKVGPETWQVDCAVVIVTFNNASHIVGLLDSIPSAAESISARVVVVDNGSTDSTVELVRRRSGIICVETGSNLGYAAAINIGRQRVGPYRALLVLNPDVTLEAGAIGVMFAALLEPGIGIVVPMLLSESGRCYPSLRREPRVMRALGDGLLGHRISSRPGWLSEMVWLGHEYERSHLVDWATGAVMMVSASCDRAVGDWDESFFLYSEETDYAKRSRSAGFGVKYEPRARARHAGGGSGGSASLVALMAVNRVRYAEKHSRHHLLYRLMVVVNELLRAGGEGHRLALRSVVRRSEWPGLVRNLKAQSMAGLSADAVGVARKVAVQRVLND